MRFFIAFAFMVVTGSFVFFREISDTSSQQSNQAKPEQPPVANSELNGSRVAVAETANNPTSTPVKTITKMAEPEVLAQQPREAREWPVRVDEAKHRYGFNVPAKEAMLRAVTEIRFNNDVEGRHYLRSRDKTQGPKEVGKVADRIVHHPSLRGLPWRQGAECVKEGAIAERLSSNSREIRSFFGFVSNYGSDGLDAIDCQQKIWQQVSKFLHRSKSSEQLTQPEAASVLMQKLQAEPVSFRLTLVVMLDSISGKDASEALAKLAVFDLDQRVREWAIDRLRHRPEYEWQHVVFSGFQHIWPPASEHAAAALIAMKPAALLPGLIPFLDAPDPALPTVTSDSGKSPMVRELVSLNHHQNCAICHATKDPFAEWITEEQLQAKGKRNGHFRLLSPDLFRVRVPSLDQPLPNPFEYYADQNRNDFVQDNDDPLFIRFDVTYLRQDFSATLPVDDSGKWPSRQRFDFFTRLRPATAAEIETAKQPRQSFPQKEAVKLVLRTLTGKDGGDSSREWEQILLNLPRN